ncbi:hypothetical protein A3A21_03460 [Candidatus Jorgensenbacteria bacterium RIFCSPLOWO2_01_FULL_45_25b]|uniref:Carbohydrate kinase PfkB domain-containing protein n=1 Tax=Candidatus Jorgensenbacteria bacterium RIFCSPLOWO2_01_FULL_45_25b TaxID=1798471 RepID=A0A1F6BZ08_9BACT|nr:MAG: hypothetical protein A3A21_03460 [Candidatus Jorgensenbacteria bacterium RIFCSPLOWO2_01_FULL_45_25b]
MFDVITIGTATRDVFLTSGEFRVLKDPEHLEKLGFPTAEAECFALGGKVEVESPFFTTGGGALNAAVTFSRAGLKTGAVFKIGKDEIGRDLLSDIKKENVLSIPAYDKSLCTAYSTIILNKTGERTVLVYRGASNSLEKRDVPLSKLRAKWAYVVSGYTSLSLMEQVFSSLKKQGASIALSPSKHYAQLGHQKLKAVLRYVDLLIMNREEAAAFTREEYNREKKIFKKFDEIVRGIAIMTDGERGAYVSDGRYLYRSGVFKEKKLVDRTGAGDAFGSGFVAGLIEKNDISYALRFATANATSVVEHIGAQAGILKKKDFQNKRWGYLDLDVEPL